MSNSPPPRRTPKHKKVEPSPAPNPRNVNKLTVIYDPKQMCDLKAVLGDTDECHDDFYIISPATLGNKNEIVKGCSLHLPRTVSHTELFTLEFNHLTKLKHQKDKEGRRMHNADGSKVLARDIHRREVIVLQNVIDFLNNEFKNNITDKYE